MKSKTAFSAIASIMLAGAMCMSFAACGAEEEDGDVRAKIDGLTGEEVTEEVWNAALYSESDIYNNVCNNFAIDLVKTYKTEDGTEKETHHCVHVGTEHYRWAILDYSAMEEIHEGSLEGFEQLGGSKYKTEAYYNSATDEYFETNNKGKWYTPTGRDGAFDLGLSYLSNMIFLVSYADYSDYTYNEEKKGYVYATTEENGSEIEFIVKFFEGKLISLEFNSGKEKNGIIAQNLYYITYGGQSVTHPEVG